MKTDSFRPSRAVEARAIEAVLMVATEPLATQFLAGIVETTPEEVERICIEISGWYESNQTGFQLVKVAGGWRFASHPDMYMFVEKFAKEGFSTRLSAAAMETLAIVAYKQPLSRSQIAAVRGVNSDGVIRLLSQRGYISVHGHASGPGQPGLYGTTPAFLEKLGLNSLDDLPPLAGFVPGLEEAEVLDSQLGDSHNE
ncbi:MAG: SMC-Scp complex subunit ScpB [Actinobacteria bacterium]|jgi:segregation and condensation protein B|nr:SMC-Scp complex subunit ScpB [Actinomycetota bacterium]MCL6105384.1 SMC-Scp complex subunit ScpB [Actinomycetota bacterium]